jgi:hypothetical protein
MTTATSLNLTRRMTWCSIQDPCRVDDGKSHHDCHHLGTFSQVVEQRIPLTECGISGGEDPGVGAVHALRRDAAVLQRLPHGLQDRHLDGPPSHQCHSTDEALTEG